MKYRVLGKTGLQVSEIGFGGEWLERHEESHSIELIQYAHSKGINIIDCWMPDPKSRDIIGKAISDCREDWYIQGHFGSTWQNEQYVRTRDLEYVIPAFEDLLNRCHTDYIDLGMIHYVDKVDEWNWIQTSNYLQYILDLKEKGIVKHIGMSTHNPKVAKMAATCDYIEMILFSINPAFDMQPANEDYRVLFKSDYDTSLSGIDPERVELYQLCEKNNVGITVMKGYAGGRLFDKERSPFKVALTPVQCIHYCLTRPSVCSILCGYDTKEQIDQAIYYEMASDQEKDYASILANAPLHSYRGQCTYCGHCKPCVMNLDIALINKFYDLASMQEKIPETIKEHYLSLDVKASSCIGCKACEKRCPFEVKIAKRMQKASQLFGQ